MLDRYIDKIFNKDAHYSTAMLHRLFDLVFILLADTLILPTDTSQNLTKQQSMYHQSLFTAQVNV